jgi:hypothetical protein
MVMEYEEWHARARNAELAANRILADLGYSAHRIVFLDEILPRLETAPVDVREYFSESILCLKEGLNRSAIVVAWAGFFSLFCEKLYIQKESELRIKRDKWVFKDAEELKETQSESHILIAAKDIAFISKPKLRMLDGWLSQRNQCAHPTVYRPSANTAIGFVSSMVDEILPFLAPE